MATMTKLMLTNPEFDFDAYLANGGKLLHLVVPDEQERFWSARAAMLLSTMDAEEARCARARFDRIGRYFQRIAERTGGLTEEEAQDSGLTEEEAQDIWRKTAIET
jgi:hypothetical protein